MLLNYTDPTMSRFAFVFSKPSRSHKLIYQAKIPLVHRQQFQESSTDCLADIEQIIKHIITCQNLAV